MYSCHQNVVDSMSELELRRKIKQLNKQFLWTRFALNSDDVLSEVCVGYFITLYIDKPTSGGRSVGTLRWPVSLFVCFCI
jgi:hypothetical protein